MKKFMLYVLTYIAVTFVAAFGTIATNTLLINATNNGNQNTQQQIGVTQATDGEKLLDSILAMGGSSINLNFDIYESQPTQAMALSNNSSSLGLAKINVKFVGDLSIADLENIKLAGTLDVNMENTEVIIDIAFIDNVLYISNETMDIKLESASISKIMALLPTLGLNLDLGDSFADIDTETILENFQSMKAEVLESGDLRMPLKLTENIVFDILTDANYNIRSIQANRIKLQDKIATFSANLIKDETIVINNPEQQKEYVDVTKTLNILDSVSEILANKKLHLNLDAKLLGEVNLSLLGAVDIDFSNNLNLFASFDAMIDDNAQKVSVGVIEDDLYLTINDLNFKLKKENLQATIDTISNYFDIEQAQQNILASIAQIIPDFELSKVLTGDFSNFNINNLLSFAKGEENVISVTIFGKALGIENDILIEIKLDPNDQFSSVSISNIKLLNSVLSANLTYSNQVTMPILNQSEYVELQDIAGFANALLNTVHNIKQTKIFAVDLCADVSFENLSLQADGSLSIDFNDKSNLKTHLNLSAKINNKTFQVIMCVINTDIYIIVDNLKFKTSFAEIADVIQTAKSVVQNKTQLDLIANALQMLTTSNQIVDFISGDINKLPQKLISSMYSTIGRFGLSISKDVLGLGKDVDINVAYGTKLNEITVNNINKLNTNIALGLILPNEVYNFNYQDYEYTSLANLNDLLKSVVSSVNKITVDKKFATKIDVNIVKDNNAITITGNLALNNGIVYANLNIKVNERAIPMQLHITNNILYVVLDGLKVKLSIDQISSLSHLFNNEIELTQIIEQIMPHMDLSQISAGDWSSLTLDLIKSIDITSNKATVVLSNQFIASETDLTIALTYNGEITSFELNGVDIQGVKCNAQLVSVGTFGIPEIVGEYSDLTNIEEFVSALQQTISQITNNKQIAFDINATVMAGDKNCGIVGKIFIDFSKVKKQLALQDLEIYASIKLTLNKSYDLVLNVNDGYVFVECQNLKLKIDVQNLSNLIQYLKEILPAESLNINFGNLIAGSVVNDLLNKNYDSLNFALIKQLTLNNNSATIVLAKETIALKNDFGICLRYGDKFTNLAVNNLCFENFAFDAGLTFDYAFVPNAINVDEYQDISNIQSFIASAVNTINDVLTNKQIALQISNAKLSVNNNIFTIDGTIYANFKNAITDDGKINGLIMYVDLRVIDQTNYIHKVNLIYNGTTIYLTYNNLNFSLSANNLKTIIGLIEQFKFISESLTTQDLTNISMRSLVEQAKVQAEQHKQKFDVMSIIKSILPNLNIEAIINKDFSNFDLSILKYLAFDENTLRLTLDKDFVNSSTDTEININFGNSITGLRIDGFNANDISVCGDVALLSSFTMPDILDTSIYTNLDMFESAVNSTLNTAIEVIDNKQIAFGLQANFVYTSIKKDSSNNPILCTETIVQLLPTSNAKFDWNNAYTTDAGVNKLDVKKMKIYVNFEVITTTNTYYYTNNIKNESASNSVVNNHSIEIYYIDNVIYIRYNKMYAKIGGGSLNQIVQTICEIFGIETSTNLFNNLKNLISSSSNTSIFNSFKVEMIKSLDLTNSHFGIIADFSNLNMEYDLFDCVKLDVDYSTDGLKTVALKDLQIKNINIDNLSIGLTEFDGIDQAPAGDYIDLSGVEDLLTAIKNSKDFKDFEIDGSAQLKIDVIGINIDWDIPVNAKIKLLEDGEFEANIKLGAIPVVPGVNDDVPFKAGNVTSGIYSGLNRILSIYIKNNMVYLYRSETVPTTIFQADRIYEKKMKIHIETLLDDPLYYILQYGFGFSDKIMAEIYNSFYKERQNPIDFSNVLKGFSASEDYYSLTLNLKELVEDDKLDTMTLGLRTIDYKGNIIIGGFTVDMFMPVASNVEITIKSNNLNLTNIGGTTDMSAMYEFVSSNNWLQEGASWDAYDGDWKLSSQREFTLHFVTNCDITLDDVTGVAGTQFELPILANYFVDDGDKRIYYTFVGWYTTTDFAYGTEYNENVISRKDTTLYAKWTSTSKNYVTIDFVTNGGEAQQSITKLQGENIELPNYIDVLIVEIDNTTYTKQFDGWYYDGEFSSKCDLLYMPEQNTTLYAKWSVVDCVSSYQLSVYDVDEKIFVRRIAEGQSIELSGAKFNATTLYYLNNDYTNQIDLTTFTMPGQDTTIYIRNKYSLKVVSNFGTVLNYVVEMYQGEAISIDAQSSYEFDTYLNGKQDKRYYYTFNGYFANETLLQELTFTMPNNDIEIVASWTEQIKNYYTITFDTRWYIPVGWVSNGIEVTAPNQIESLTVLEGTDLDLTNYVSTTQRKYTRISKTYTWKSTSWGVEPFSDLSIEKGVTSLTNIQQSYTLYACWEKQ